MLNPTLNYVRHLISNFLNHSRPFRNVLDIGILPNLAWGIFMCFNKGKEYNREFIEYLIKNRLETSFYLGNGEYTF